MREALKMQAIAHISAPQTFPLLFTRALATSGLFVFQTKPRAAALPSHAPVTSLLHNQLSERMACVLYVWYVMATAPVMACRRGSRVGVGVIITMGMVGTFLHSALVACWTKLQSTGTCVLHRRACMVLKRMLDMLGCY